MSKNMLVRIQDRQYAVAVEEGPGGRLLVTVEGQTFIVSEEEPCSGPRAEAAPAAAEASAQTPMLRPRSRSGGMMTGSDLKAPMPGVILDLQVKAGDRVSVGQPLCALEAMKMKNAIRAPREGTIAAVEVEEGQKVSHGEVLFRFAQD